jgi:D-alanine-D-alanine ligase
MSSEHEVSLLSAESVIRNLDPEKYEIYPVGITKAGNWYLFRGPYEAIGTGAWEKHPENLTFLLTPDRSSKGLAFEGDGLRPMKIDCIFPVLHGENGEDGTMQGLFELCGIPYVGCGVRASADCMDKEITKIAAASAGVRQAKWVTVMRSAFEKDPEGTAERIEREFGYPVFVKPANTGSSVGISKAKNRGQLVDALKLASNYDSKILVEEFIDGMEIEIAVLGDNDPMASVCGRILPSREFYSYEAKYIDGTSGLLIPADIPVNASNEVAATAKKVFTMLGCEGLSRVDFFVKKGTYEVIFNEINTMPGFTCISMYPKLFEASGISYPELLDRLIGLAMNREKKGRA